MDPFFDKLLPFFDKYRSLFISAIIKIALIYFIVGSIIIFVWKDEFIQKISEFNPLTNDYSELQTIIIIALLFYPVSFLILVYFFIKYVIKKWSDHKERKKMTETFNSLTDEEKLVIREFFIQEDEVIELPNSNPLILTLAGKKIIIRFESNTGWINNQRTTTTSYRLNNNIKNLIDNEDDYFQLKTTTEI